MKKWLDERLQFSTLIASMFEHPVPKPSSFMDYLGFATFFIFLSQAITGILLATAYIPSATDAWESIKNLEATPVGHFVRSIHSWGANFMIVLVLFHLLRVFYEAAYKKPRELTWLLGVILLIGTIGLSFTGYLLPWDQQGYWASTVGTAMAAYVPLIGEFVVRVMRNGSEVTGATLTRFYSVHMLLLTVLILIAFAPHFFFVLRQGMSATDELTAAKRRGENIETRSMPFWPNVAWRMMLTLLLVGIALWVAATLAPKGLGDPADPLNKNQYIPQPAWYFFGVYQLLKYFPPKLDPLAMVGLPAIAIIVLVGLPWFDRNPSRFPRQRPIALAVATLLVAGMAYLTYQGFRSVPKALVTTTVTQPSYKRDIDPIFQNKCVMCHGNSGNYHLDTYAGVTMKNVIPGNPNDSVLVKKITGVMQPQMPLGQKPLSSGQIQTIKNWIQDGAKNN